MDELPSSRQVDASPTPASTPGEEGAAPPVAPAAQQDARDASAFRRRAWLVLLLIAVVVLALDQGTKQWAHQTLRVEHGGRLTVIADYMVLNYVRNPGAAWGFLARTKESFRHPFFLSVSILAMLFILYIHWRLEPGQYLLLVAISLIMGGALGNFIDRVRLRYVIDFIEVHWRHRLHWPTFNIADVAITIGVGLLLCEMLFGPWLRRRAQARSEREGLA